jgi:uncharacterized protein (DUF3820 family)
LALHEGPPLYNGRLKTEDPEAYRKWWFRFRIDFISMMVGLVLALIGLFDTQDLSLLFVIGIAMMMAGFIVFWILIPQR